tara:strand:+ start:7158 stop:8684 length:1527 start_codon:yes stop_codon:yes gene_type:complete
MPIKKYYSLKSLFIVFASLVLISNFQSIFQNQNEHITRENSQEEIIDSLITTKKLIVSFGLSNKLNSRLRQYFASDSLVTEDNYVIYPLLGNNEKEKTRRETLQTQIENSSSLVLFVAFQEWTHLALEIGSETNLPNLQLVLLNPTPLPDSYLLGGYYLNNLFIQTYGLTLRILYHIIPHFDRLKHLKERAEKIRLVSGYQLSHAMQHSFELSKISKVIRTRIDDDNRWVMNEKQQIPLLDSFVQTNSLVSKDIMYVEDERTLAQILPIELASLDKIDSQEALKLTWDSTVEEEFSLEKYVQVSGIYLVLLMLIISLISLFSEDLACISAGVLASRGVLHLSNAIIASALGVIVFDVFIYVLGRIFKRGWLEKMPLKWMITEKDLDYFTGWFSKNAAGVLWLSRFIPGSRFPAYFSAGLCRYPFFSFMLHFIASTLVWAPILGILAYLLGQEMMNYYESYYGYIPQLILGLSFSLYFLFNWIIPLTTPLGRRKIFRRWIRLKKLYSVK